MEISRSVVLRLKPRPFSYINDIQFPIINESVKLLMNGKQKSDVKPGISVAIILKEDQRTGKKTAGIVKDILTNSKFHPHGIKVRLEDGQVGRVQEILSGETT